MNIGAGQTLGTCWFFSSINIFLTSDNGLKILWQKLQEVLPKLSARQRNYFNSNINAPCPYKGSVKKTSAIYFWKFLNQYICAVGGPGRILPKSGLNAYLTKNIKWRGEAAKETKGQYGGGNPYVELPVILGHLGFKIGSDFRMLDFERWKYQFRKPNWTAPILMYRSEASLTRTPLQDLMLEKRGYELTGAIIYAKSEDGSVAHVWACTIRNGKGYITDSNYPVDQKPLEWWRVDEVKNYFRTLPEYPYYRLDVARYIAFDVILYTRKDYTNKISPYCLLPPGGYRPLTNSNKARLERFMYKYKGTNIPGLISTRPRPNIHGRYSARVLAEAMRPQPRANARVFNAALSNATSYNAGMMMLGQMTNNKGVRYNINENSPNFKNFKTKLIAKFPRPVPKNVFDWIWKKSKGNEVTFARSLKEYAFKAGYAFPENKVRNIIARRQATRVGAKRKRRLENERVYLLNGKNWINNNGRRVNVNPNNWVRTNSNAEVNNAIRFMLSNNNTSVNKIETFRRKTVKDI
jgi:hypothetical protein